MHVLTGALLRALSLLWTVTNCTEQVMGLQDESSKLERPPAVGGSQMQFGSFEQHLCAAMFAQKEHATTAMQASQ